MSLDQTRQEIIEGWLPMTDGTRLFTRFSPPQGPPKGTILLSHGMGEHLGRYDHVAEALRRRGFRFCAYDMRGHGRSDGVRGDIPRYAVLLDDLEAVLATVRKESPPPIFLYGHSTGAQVTINFLAERRPEAAGAVFTSPWLRLAFLPKRLKRVLARIALVLYPGFTQTTGMNPGRLSRDADFLASLPDLDLVHRRMSARMYRELVDGGLRALAHGADLTLPVLLLHGADDPVTSAEASREFFATLASADKTLKLYPGMRHETHNELGREQVLEEIGSWLEAEAMRRKAIPSR